MNFDLALFLPEHDVDGASLFDQVDGAVKPHARERHLESWHPYEWRCPHLCLEHPPMALLTVTGVWHERAAKQELAATRLVKTRQRDFAAIIEEEQARNPETASARSLVRMAIWEADRKFPLTPWRKLWREVLLDHADALVVYLACEMAKTDGGR
ncbi:MAG: hypothetical protein H0U76_22095 [Ktedonobacteraceae bacterium]|nr:hypothetical protein [Ktedonobacteraceae bacterium]